MNIVFLALAASIFAIGCVQGGGYSLHLPVLILSFFLDQSNVQPSEFSIKFDLKGPNWPGERIHHVKARLPGPE